MGGSQSNSSKDEGDGGSQVGLDDFQILRAIGKGSFGKVCIVQKKSNKKNYAMKYMNKLKCLEKSAFGNVLREVEILVDLNHPFLVNMWYTFQDFEDLFMVFDLLLGGDLRYHLNQEGRFSEDRVKLYVCEIALALDYLAQKNIIHRDIKPENIVLDDTGHAHITDFNIATFLPYMAPEIFSAGAGYSEGYSFPVDWWSLGVTVFELLRGRRPFDITVQMSCDEVCEILRASPLTIPAEWSDDFVSFLSGLLQLNPDKRIASLQQMSAHCYMQRINFKDVLRKTTCPVYIPRQDSLNCDPTFELEEMIIENNPLHNKKARRQRSHSSGGGGGGGGGGSDEAVDDPRRRALEQMAEEYKVYNREELLRNEQERVARLEVELGIRPKDGEPDALGKRLGDPQEKLPAAASTSTAKQESIAPNSNP